MYFRASQYSVVTQFTSRTSKCMFFQFTQSVVSIHVRYYDLCQNYQYLKRKSECLSLVLYYSFKNICIKRQNVKIISATEKIRPILFRQKV